MQNCFCCRHCLLITNPVQTNLSNLTVANTEASCFCCCATYQEIEPRNACLPVTHKKSLKSRPHTHARTPFSPLQVVFTTSSSFCMQMRTEAGGGDRITPHWSFRFDANGRKGRERRRFHHTHSEVGIVSSRETAPEKRLE